MNTKNIMARAAEIIAQRTVRQDKDSFATQRYSLFVDWESVKGEVDAHSDFISESS